MCVIAIKPKNKPIQDKKILERCFTINRDGAGYMYVNSDNRVVIKKGFMKFEDFYKSVMKDYEQHNLEKQNLIMHFRIGTSGKNKLGCTHPFPITDKMDELELTACKTNIGICHNGIVTGFNGYANQYSDTELYIATVITPIIRLNLQAYKFKDVQALILKTTNSKWAVLDKNDEFYTIGAFVEDNGYYYSNESFRPPMYTVPYRSYFDDFDDEDDLGQQSAWYHRAYGKQNQIDRRISLPSPQTATKSTYNSLIATKEKPDEKLYKELKKGNVVCAEATDAYYKKQLTFLEVKQDDEYYFDKDYKIYRRFKGKDKDNLHQIGIKATIYTNESLVQRRGFNE
jgi:predicted glutamine amidotransferase